MIMENQDKLTAEDTSKYLEIVKKGNIHDMFDFGYAMGEKHAYEKMQHEMVKFTQEFPFKDK